MLDPQSERLTEVGERLVRCDTDKEFLARVDLVWSKGARCGALGVEAGNVRRYELRRISTVVDVGRGHWSLRASHAWAVRTMVSISE